MSEELISLKDLAQEHSPQKRGVFATEMIRRCRLRNVPVYFCFGGISSEKVCYWNSDKDERNPRWLALVRLS